MLGASNGRAQQVPVQRLDVVMVTHVAGVEAGEPIIQNLLHVHPDQSFRVEVFFALHLGKRDIRWLFLVVHIESAVLLVILARGLLCERGLRLRLLVTFLQKCIDLVGQG